jgi:proline iminopeptidase
MAAYHRRLFCDEKALQLEAARAWSYWEWSTSALIPEVEGGTDDKCLAFARIENHYFVNKGFLDTHDQLLANADRLASIPSVIVHGRYDVICPVRNAWELHKAMPHAELRIIPDAGHSVAESGITDALIDATNRFAGISND